MILPKTLSLAILNYALLAIKVSFQCGASKIKVSKLGKKKKTHDHFEENMQKKFHFNLKKFKSFF